MYNSVFYDKINWKTMADLDVDRKPWPDNQRLRRTMYLHTDKPETRKIDSGLWRLGKAIGDVLMFGEASPYDCPETALLYEERNLETGEMVGITFGDIVEAIKSMKIEKGLRTDNKDR